MALRPVETPPKPLIILASASPRRQELLRAVGLSFVVVPPSIPSTASEVEGRKIQVDETPLPGETPVALVQRLSRSKAQAIVGASQICGTAFPGCSDRLESLSHFPKIWDRKRSASHFPQGNIVIIAADTVVVFDNKILGKPGDATEATQMLKQLRSQVHHVHSGLTVTYLPQTALLTTTHAESVFITRLHQSRVWMRPYTDAEIAAYVASGDPLDKAGAYAIQNRDFAPVERLEGCFASVMGLPLGELAVAFREIDLSLPEISPLCAHYTGHPCCQNNL